MDNTHNELPQQAITIQEEEGVKVFQGLKNSAIMSNPQLLDILDLNAEQLTYYLEDAILDNPFIELEYNIERKVPGFERYDGSKAVEANRQSSQSLDTYLFEQIMLYRQTPIRDAMVKLIEHLDDRGYLPHTLAELADMIEADAVITLDALTLVKQLEPAGIGANNLQECMMLQTERDEHAPRMAYYFLEVFFKALADQDYAYIHEETGIEYEEIMESVNYFHTLRTNPAALFDQVDKMNLIPDVSVKVAGEGLEISYNRQYYPKIIFNQRYYEEMKATDDPEVIAFIEPHEEGYQVLADNLRIREQLILEVVLHIVRAHQSFFQQETTQMSVLSIREIARQSRLPESLVYQIVANKNLAFNSQVYPLTDFINVSLATTRDGLRASYIKEAIQGILAQAGETLTDEEIVEQLNQEKILVGKQIVANYRKALGKE